MCRHGVTDAFPYAILKEVYVLFEEVLSAEQGRMPYLNDESS